MTSRKQRYIYKYVSKIFEHVIFMLRNTCRRPAIMSSFTVAARNPRSPMPRALASNPTTPPATLEALAADADWLVRRAVAYNPNTPT